MISAISMAAAVVAAGMRLFPMRMVVMVTIHIGIERKIARDKRINRLISISADTAEKLNSRFCKRRLCTAADTAANQNICFDSV